MKNLLVLFVILISCLSAQSQYTVEDIDEEEIGDKNLSGTLSSKDIFLMCMINPNAMVQYSADKVEWEDKRMRYRKAIEITLDEGYAYFFVRVCTDGEPVRCTNFRLKPGNRYLLIRDSDTRMAKIVAGKN